VRKDGSVKNLAISKSTEDELLDRAALEAIYKAAPLKPMPQEFKGEYLYLRMHFRYNPPNDEHWAGSQP
jgi:TonB family protein